MYSDVRNFPVPKKATVVGYDDDIVLVVAAKHLDDVGLCSSEAISVVKLWLGSAGLRITEEKTEAVFIPKRRKRNLIRIKIGSHIITSKPAISISGNDARCKAQV